MAFLQGRIPTTQKIPASLLAKAKSASLAGFVAQLDLVKILTPQNYTMDVLGVFLHHLSSDLLVPPPHIDKRRAKSLMTDRTRAACLAGTQGLCAVIHRGCPPDARLKEATAKEILANLNPILAWYAYILASPPEPEDFDLKDPIRMCATLQAMIDFDPVSRRVLYSSPDMASLAISALSLRNSSGVPYVSFEGFVDTCPIVSLFADCAFYDRSRERLSELLCDNTKASAKLRVKLASATIARLRALGGMEKRTVIAQLKMGRPAYQESPQIAVMKVLAKLTAGVRDMCTRYPVMLSVFLKMGFLQALCQTLVTWIIKNGDKGRTSKGDSEARHFGHLTLSAALRLLEAEGSTQGRQFITALCGMVDGGLVELIMDGMQSIPRNHEDSSAVYTTLFACTALCIYPTSAMRICLSLQRLRGDRYIRTDFLKGNGNEVAWEVLCSEASRVAAVSGSRSGNFPVNICDNFNCRSNKSEETVSGVQALTKACSGCRSVVYCSKNCQAEDWSVQHRTECREARVDYATIAYNLRHYPQSLRRFHVQLIHSKFSGAMLTWEKGLHSGPWGRKQTVPILVLDTVNTSEYSYEDYPYHQRLAIPPNGSKSKTHTVHYFDARADRILQEFYKGMERGIRVVEGIHRFGNKEIFTMVKFKRVSDSHVTVLSSVSRIGPLRSETEDSETVLAKRATL
ncbi:hypothetical protein DFP72DRAFT_932076 [Ephemerocybe angulata]|uniref:MYND-type domain-containing protein n=1 Tax=Ephemerocybe angulata TaxID=980116 RepID=A0A8H6LV15_9AGAR|nr:hypothetical protein DFP72DRAFT_932076 [Tulosesus angulatus]